MKNKHGITIRVGDLVTFFRADHTQGIARVEIIGKRVVQMDDGTSAALDDIIRNEGLFDDSTPGLLIRNNPKRRKSMAATKKRAAPRRKAVAGKIGSPSQATGKKPTARLVARRKKTAAAPMGVYANPSEAFSSVEWKGLVHHLVQVKPTYGQIWKTRGVFKTKNDAHEYAKALHRADDSLAIRVISGK